MADEQRDRQRAHSRGARGAGAAHGLMLGGTTKVSSTIGAVLRCPRAGPVTRGTVIASSEEVTVAAGRACRRQSTTIGALDLDRNRR
jgi:hypothetical protein